MAHLLIVDDGRDGADGPGGELSTSLRQQRHRVTGVTNADEALSHLVRHRATSAAGTILGGRPRLDLLVLPISMLDAGAVPLMEAVCAGGHEAGPGGFISPDGAPEATPIALFWGERINDERGGPNPFGAGYFVAAADTPVRTSQRILACLDAAASAAGPRSIVLPRPLPLAERVA